MEVWILLQQICLHSSVFIKWPASCSHANINQAGRGLAHFSGAACNTNIVHFPAKTQPTTQPRVSAKDIGRLAKLTFNWDDLVLPQGFLSGSSKKGGVCIQEIKQQIPTFQTSVYFCWRRSPCVLDISTGKGQTTPFHCLLFVSLRWRYWKCDISSIKDTESQREWRKTLGQGTHMH